jgi:hypothetical protein
MVCYDAATGRFVTAFSWRSLIEQLAMTTQSGQFQVFTIDLVNQEPVRLDVAFAIAASVSSKLVIAEVFFQWLFICKCDDN